MQKLSTIIVVKNSPPYLFKVIKSVKDISDEIVIVDIGIDEMIKNDLLKNEKIRIKEIKQPVPYVELIREKSKDFAKNDYILLLDPDEIVPENLSRIIRDNIGKYDYFRIPRKNIIFNRWIKHSRWWPDYQVRLFRKEMINWPVIIHQQPKVSGREYVVEPVVENALIHYNYENLDEYILKARRYASHEAEEFIQSKKKLTFSETVRRSLNEFFSRYYQGKGYKDGNHGFVLACLQMFYYFLVYFYYLEKIKFKSEKDIDPAEFFRSGVKQSLHYKKNKNIKDWLVKKIC